MRKSTITSRALECPFSEEKHLLPVMVKPSEKIDSGIGVDTSSIIFDEPEQSQCSSSADSGYESPPRLESTMYDARWHPRLSSSFRGAPWTHIATSLSTDSGYDSFRHTETPNPLTKDTVFNPFFHAELSTSCRQIVATNHSISRSLSFPYLQSDIFPEELSTPLTSAWDADSLPFMLSIPDYSAGSTVPIENDGNGKKQERRPYTMEGLEMQHMKQWDARESCRSQEKKCTQEHSRAQTISEENLVSEDKTGHEMGTEFSSGFCDGHDDITARSNQRDSKKRDSINSIASTYTTDPVNEPFPYSLQLLPLIKSQLLEESTLPHFSIVSESSTSVGRQDDVVIPSLTASIRSQSSEDYESDDCASEITDYSGEWRFTARERRNGVQFWVLSAFGNEVQRKVSAEINGLFQTYDGIISHAGQEDSNSTSRSGLSVDSSIANVSCYSNSKRPLDTRDSNSPNDGPNKRRKINSHLPSNAMIGMRFACPYYKRNPGKHQIWRACAGPGWDSVHRAKEHVYRRHKLPVTCHRCSSEFLSDADLKEHSQLLIPCNVAEARDVQGYDNDQERKLRSRKRQPGQTEVDKWNEMFRILFPHDREIPSPFYEPSDWHDYQNLSKFKNYLIEQLPKKIQNDIDPELQLLDRSLDIDLGARISASVRNHVDELFRTYPRPLSPGSIILPDFGKLAVPSQPSVLSYQPASLYPDESGGPYLSLLSSFETIGQSFGSSDRRSNATTIATDAGCADTGDSQNATLQWPELPNNKESFHGLGADFEFNTDFSFDNILHNLDPVGLLVADCSRLPKSAEDMEKEEQPHD